MNIIRLFLIIFLAGTLAFVTSCKKETTSPAQTDESIQSAKDNSLSDNEFESIFELVNAEGNTNPKISSSASSGQPQIQADSNELKPPCAIITFDTATKTLVIDFGTTDCLCRDSIYRRGKIIAQFTGKWRTVGSKVSITLQDYFFNKKYQVKGTKTIEIQPLYRWKIDVTGAQIITDSGTISWSSSVVIQQTQGMATKTVWDDVFMYSGSESGTNRNGVNFTVTIDQPLKKKIQWGCLSTFVSGIITIKNSNGASISVNYDPWGGEPCDHWAVATINGKQYTFRAR